MKKYKEKYEGQLDILSMLEVKIEKYLKERYNLSPSVLQEKVDKILDEFYEAPTQELCWEYAPDNVRVCKICGHLMDEGFFDNNTGECYCSADCTCQSYRRGGVSEEEAKANLQTDIDNGDLSFVVWA